MRVEIAWPFGKQTENYSFILPILRDWGGPLLWHIMWMYREIPVLPKKKSFHVWNHERFTRGRAEGEQGAIKRQTAVPAWSCIRQWAGSCPLPWHWFAPQWWERGQQCSCSCTTSHHLLGQQLEPPAVLHWNSHLLHCTHHSEYTEWQRPRKINCRFIQSLTGRYLHKTVLISCRNRINSELRVSGFAVTPIYFLSGKHRDGQ